MNRPLKKRNTFSERRFIISLMISLTIVTGCKSGNTDSNSSKNSTAVSVPAPDNDYFQEIGKQIGIDFVNTIGEEHVKNIVESSGGGTAFLDYDQDGYIDLYTTTGTWKEGVTKTDKPDVMPHNHLYHNLGNGTFEDVTEKARLDDPYYTMGITVGDFNNDGYPDIYLSNYGTNVLYRNNKNGTFTDVTKRSGTGGGDHDFSVGSTWLDYDNDGYLDLYVGNYLNFDPDYKYYYAPDGFPGPLAYDAQPDILYHNNGDGTFENATEKMGIKDVDGRAMGVGAADYDDDGFVDIYVANDHTVNYLWHNDGGIGFTDRGTMSGTGFSQAGEATVSMSVDFADFNNDGLLDIFLSDDKYCSLYENLGNGVFSDKSYTSGISMPAGQYVGWSTGFVDYDNDGDVDIFKINGELKHLYGQEDQLFENEGNGLFKDVSADRGAYFHQELVGRGACFGDYDNDGDIDVYVENLNNYGSFLRNNKGNQDNWLEIKLVGTSSNADGLGARVRITSGGKSQYAQKKCTTGYLSQSDPRMHFGLAKNDNADSIEIKWPSGKTQKLENIKANQIITITEPKN